MSWATCHDPIRIGCFNNNKPIDVGSLIYIDEDGEHTSSVECGVCDQPITDITEERPPDADDT